MFKKFSVLASLFGVLFGGAVAHAKDTQFWNLTQNKITKLQLSQPGKNEWGADQTANDSDHIVDADERLKITDVVPGKYDVRFTDDTQRVCTVRNVLVKLREIFSIDEAQLKDACK